MAYDALTYAGNLENLRGLEQSGRFEFVRGDICEPAALDQALAGGTWAVVNFAAETHVDRSIHGSAEFVRTNVLGTQTLLDAARRSGVARYLQVSTDEVYGSLGPEGAFCETTPLAPNSPYSASKAGADLLVRAYYVTHGLPALVTRCSNNYGPYQFPEKVIPLFISNLLENRKVPLYGDGLNVRDWIHVQDHCDAILAVLNGGRPGEIYNVGGGNELTNRALTYAILKELGKGEEMIQPVRDRPAHDRRYAVDCRKLRTELGWAPQIEFASGLRETVRWYRENASWWRAIKSGEYQNYYQQMYGRTGSDGGNPLMRVLILGARGQLGTDLCARLGPAAVGVDLPELDATQAAQVHEVLERVHPAVVINCVAQTNVDECERNPEAAFAANALRRAARGARNRPAGRRGAVRQYRLCLWEGTRRRARPSGSRAGSGRGVCPSERALVYDELARAGAGQRLWDDEAGGRASDRSVQPAALHRAQQRTIRTCGGARQRRQLRRNHAAPG